MYVNIHNIVCYVQMLLEAHQAWYQVQRCTDLFESRLKIDKLRNSLAVQNMPPTVPTRRTPASALDAAPAADPGKLSSLAQSPQGLRCLAHAFTILHTIQAVILFSSITQHQCCRPA